MPTVTHPSGQPLKPSRTLERLIERVQKQTHRTVRGFNETFGPSPSAPQPQPRPRAPKISVP